VPKHVVEIKDYAVVYVLVALVTGNKLRSLIFPLICRSSLPGA